MIVDPFLVYSLLHKLRVSNFAAVGKLAFDAEHISIVHTIHLNYWSKSIISG